MAASTAQQTAHAQLVVPARWARAPLLIFCSAPLATIAVSYPLALADGRVDSGHFFISSSIDWGLEKRIGVIGLGISSFALSLLALQRYTEVTLLAQTLPDELRRHLQRRNTIALAFGFGSALGILGVGAFNVSYLYVVHYSFAGAGFFGLFAYCLIQTWIDVVTWRNKIFCSASSRFTGHRCRVGLCCMTALGIFLGMIAITAGNLAIAAICELVVFGTQILYFWTWLCLARAGDAKAMCILQVEPGVNAAMAPLVMQICSPL